MTICSSRRPEEKLSGLSEGPKMIGLKPRLRKPNEDSLAERGSGSVSGICSADGGAYCLLRL